MPTRRPGLKRGRGGEEENVVLALAAFEYAVALMFLYGLCTESVEFWDYLNFAAPINVLFFNKGSACKVLVGNGIIVLALAFIRRPA
jgi:hypothetical protein